MGKDKSTAGKKVAEAARAAQTAQAAKQKTSSPEAKPGSSSVSARPTSQREKGSAVDQENAGAENNRDDASQGDAESSGEDDSSQGKSSPTTIMTTHAKGVLSLTWVPCGETIGIVLARNLITMNSTGTSRPISGRRNPLRGLRRQSCWKPNLLAQV